MTEACGGKVDAADKTLSRFADATGYRLNQLLQMLEHFPNQADWKDGHLWRLYDETCRAIALRRKPKPVPSLPLHDGLRQAPADQIRQAVGRAADSRVATQQFFRAKPQVDGEINAITGSELSKAVFTLEESPVDDSPNDSIRARFYCHNEECVVRRVDIDATWNDRKRPPMPEFHCPSCGEKLEFLSHLTSQVLLPVE